MISMVDKQKIIQYWHVEKKSEVEIATVLGISRNTVRSYAQCGIAWLRLYPPCKPCMQALSLQTF